MSRYWVLYKDKASKPKKNDFDEIELVLDVEDETPNIVETIRCAIAEQNKGAFFGLKAKKPSDYVILNWKQM